MNPIRTKLAELLLCSSDYASLDSVIGEVGHRRFPDGHLRFASQCNLCPKSCAKQAATLRGGKHSPERIAKARLPAPITPTPRRPQSPIVPPQVNIFQGTSSPVGYRFASS